MSGETLFGDVVHAAAADLDFHPLAVRTHHGQVQGLIAVSLRSADPIADAVGADTVNIGDGGVDIPALVLLVHTRKRVEDNTHGVNVVDILEGDFLRLHLVPDGIDGFDAGLHLVM